VTIAVTQPAKPSFGTRRSLSLDGDRQLSRRDERRGVLSAGGDRHELAVLRRNGGAGIWDTDPATSYWALGATSLDGALLNNGTGVVNFAVADGGAFYIFSADFNPSPYTSGTSFSLTRTFADGSVVTGTTTVP